MTNPQIHEALRTIDHNIDEILIAAVNGHWTEDTCPLEEINNHYIASKLLGGLGAREWSCPFCCKHFED